MLAFESAVTGDLGDQRPIPDLTERLIYAVMPHIVSVEKPKNVGSDGRRGNVYIVNGLGWISLW
jgi:hypothetical protein